MHSYDTCVKLSNLLLNHITPSLTDINNDLCEETTNWSVFSPLQHRKCHKWFGSVEKTDNIVIHNHDLNKSIWLMCKSQKLELFTGSYSNDKRFWLERSSIEINFDCTKLISGWNNCRNCLLFSNFHILCRCWWMKFINNAYSKAICRICITKLNLI